MLPPRENQCLSADVVSLKLPSMYVFSYKFRIVFTHSFVHVIVEIELRGECFQFNSKQKKLSYSE